MECKSLFIAACLLLIAYYYPSIKLYVDNLNAFKPSIKIEQEIISSWKSLIKEPEREEEAFRIAIGLNTNVDLITSAVDLLKLLNSTAATTTTLKQHNHAIINSIDEFKQTFAYFFEKGSAAERFFSQLEHFNQVIETTEYLEQKEWFIGGNAALMAQSITNRFFNVEVMLAGPIGPKLKALLNTKIKIPHEVLIRKDEVHLILEYGVNQEWANFKSPTANRFIVSHDIYNSKMEMLDTFFELTNQYNPHLLILSGLHLLESQSEDFRQEKLRSLKANLKSYEKDGSVVHLELASIGDADLMKSIIDNGILNEINSLGLNEQELLFLSHAANGPHSNYYKEIHGRPDLPKIIDILEWLLLNYGNTTKTGSNSKLTRVHFHYLLYHIIAITDTTKWSNTISSLMSGSKVASKQACDFDYHEAEDETGFHEKVFYKIETKLFEVEKDNHLLLNSTNPIIKFKRNSIYFYLTPVLVCKNPIKTVGLGDAISSTGLFYAKYNN